MDDSVKIVMVIVLSIAGTISYCVHANNQSDLDMAQAGLQQCVEPNGAGSVYKLWKKECFKSIRYE